MNSYKILVIDDNQSVLRTLKLVLNGVFKTVVTVPDPQLIPALLQAGDVDVVLLDMNFDARKLDGEEGLFWLNRINEIPNAPAVVLITAFGDIDLAVRSVQQGAEDFITKPWDNQTLIQKLEAAIESCAANLQKAAEKLLMGLVLKNRCEIMTPKFRLPSKYDTTATATN